MIEVSVYSEPEFFLGSSVKSAKTSSVDDGSGESVVCSSVLVLNKSDGELDGSDEASLTEDVGGGGGGLGLSKRSR